LGEFWNSYKKSKAGIISVFVIAFLAILAIFAPLISPYSPTNISAHAFEPPSLSHPLGTDQLGRDMFTLVIWGGRTSLEIGLVAAIIATAVGTVVGAIAAYYGGWIDSILMRGTDTMLVIPTFFLALIVAFVWGGSIQNLILIIGLTIWPTTARIVFSQVLSVKKFDFVESGRAVGASNNRLLFRHILPNSISPIIVSVAFSAAGAMLTESYLSFLGAGDSSAITWGTLLYEAVFNLKAWWLVAYPGLALAAAVVAFNMIGQATSEALDPRRRGL
jgi:peptide/nickel transport system permease protein